MRGMIFTEFLEMVESEFSADVVDDILEQSELPSGGIYTAVGTYDHDEMVALVEALARHANSTATVMLRSFGEYLFGRFAAGYPAFFESASGALEFLAGVDNYIHVEIARLYPDAELPSFECHSPRSGCLQMTYQSARPFSALAEGLIRGCIGHYGQSVDIQTEDLSDGKGTAARFVLTET
jgi:hypothetical protein